MAKKYQYVGGRVPVELKDEVEVLMAEEKKTQTELVHDMILNYIQGSKAGGQINIDGLIEGIKNALNEFEFPTQETISSEEIERLVDERLEFRLERINSKLQDVDSFIYDFDNNHYIQNDEPEDFYSELSGYRKLMVEEINCIIVDVFEDFTEEEKIENHKVLQNISSRFEEEADSPRSPECRTKFFEVLPESLSKEVGRIVGLASMDIEERDDKKEVFQKMAQLFAQASKKAFEDETAIKLNFPESTLRAMDRLMDRLVEDDIILESYDEVLKYALGRLMSESSSGLFNADKFLSEESKKILKPFK